MHTNTTSSTNNIAPIGIFDSGIGGLSVLNKIHQLLPRENFIYIADSAYAPYGDQTAPYVRRRSQIIAEFLVNQGVKAIVIACNTATAEAAEHLRETLSIPVIGLEPAIKPAAQITKSGVIGMLATQRTISSERLHRLTKRYAKNKKILNQACPGLVEKVEACELNSVATINLLKKYISPLLAQGADTLVLGCTHYPFLLPSIRIIIGQEIEILETGKPVAEQLKRILNQNQLEIIIPNSKEKSAYKGSISFYNSSTDKKHHATMNNLWQKLKPHSINNKIQVLTLPENTHDR